MTPTDTPETITRNGADSESYILRRPGSTPEPNRAKSVRAHIVNAKVGPGAAPPDGDAPSPVPVLTAGAIADNYRRLLYPVLVTETVVDGVVYRAYKEDRSIEGDGVRDTLATDRGKGTTESLDMFRKEGAVKVAGLLDKGPPRSSDGKFTKGKS